MRWQSAWPLGIFDQIGFAFSEVLKITADEVELNFKSQRSEIQDTKYLRYDAYY